ncbi:hypothetical protein [Methylobacterium sp. WSM2598]|uniref:hypothetical protein n=1 Tax=Methylobacterium sp. WSM2598 TaxID=398261 RepID=UPI0012F676E0|nr:hypothetical protein [Methylobacterium sp. WSM2598]
MAWAFPLRGLGVNNREQSKNIPGEQRKFLPTFGGLWTAVDNAFGENVHETHFLD